MRGDGNALGTDRECAVFEDDRAAATIADAAATLIEAQSIVLQDIGQQAARSMGQLAFGVGGLDLGFHVRKGTADQHAGVGGVRRQYAGTA